MNERERLVAIVSAMVIHYALVANRGSDWVASMVAEACRTSPIPGEELNHALMLLNRERNGSGKAPSN